MTTPTRFAMSRYRLHVCLLVAALASHAIGAQTAIRPVRPAAAERPGPEFANPALPPTLEKQRRDGRVASARGAVGSVTVAARCVEGVVVSGSHRASAQDVRIVAAQPRDCDGGRCRTYQVTAARDSTQPFDLEVSVTCS